MRVATEGSVAVSGDVLRYVDGGGEGPPVVLLHPYAGSGYSFVHQMDELRHAGYRAVTYSRRGHRGSTGPADVTVPFADDLRAVIDHLQLGRVHVVGTAAGGFVAADFTQNWPADVLTLTLACSMIGIQDEDYLELCRTHRPPDFEYLSTEERELTARYRASDPDGADRWRRNMPGRPVPQPPQRHPITWATVEGFDLPVLLVCGDQDPYFPVPVMEAVATRIAGVRTAVIEQTGHSAYWEQPAAFNRIVLDFLGAAG